MTLDEVMAANIETFDAVLNCQCAGTCECEHKDALALAAASQMVDIRPQGC